MLKCVKCAVVFKCRQKEKVPLGNKVSLKQHRGKCKQQRMKNKTLVVLIQKTVSLWKSLKIWHLRICPAHTWANAVSTWSAQDIKYKACQHQRQDRTVITQCPFSQFFSSSSNSVHLIGAQGNLLQEGCNLRFLISQFHLGVSTRK